jgi:hypothetical protein
MYSPIAPTWSSCGRDALRAGIVQRRLQRVQAQDAALVADGLQVARSLSTQPRTGDLERLAVLERERRADEHARPHASPAGGARNSSCAFARSSSASWMRPAANAVSRLE